MTLKHLVSLLIELSHNDISSPNKEVMVRFPGSGPYEEYQLEIVELDDEILIVIKK